VKCIIDTVYISDSLQPADASVERNLQCCVRYVCFAELCNVQYLKMFRTDICCVWTV